jgi:hypothetical protein
MSVASTRPLFAPTGFIAVFCLAAMTISSSCIAVESSSKLVPLEISKTYSFIQAYVVDERKREMEKLKRDMAEEDARTGRPATDAALTDNIPVGMRADFDACGGYSELFSRSWDKYPDSPQLHVLLVLAADVTDWRMQLEERGYPKSAFEAPIDEFQRKQLARISKLTKPELAAIFERRHNMLRFGPFEKSYIQDVKAIIVALNSYRSKNHLKVPRIELEQGECGEGGTAVKITTEPRGARVYILPVFFKKLCEAQNKNINDFQSCDRWREIHDGFSTVVSGDYVYKAKWADGTERDGNLPFTTMGEQADIVIRKP